MQKRPVMFAALGLLVLGLAGCGDSAVVKRCMKEGKSAKTCRCTDKILRSELTSEEYRLVERSAEGDNSAMEKAMQEKGLGYAFTFGGKLAGAGAKILERCGEK